MLRGTSTGVKRSVGAYRKLPSIFFFRSQGEEFQWPIDGSQQLFSHEGGQKHLGRREQADSEDDED